MANPGTTSCLRTRYQQELQLACARRALASLPQRAAPETGPGIRVCIFLQSRMTQISDTGMLYSLYQTQ